MFIGTGIEADGNCGLYALSFAEELLRIAGAADIDIAATMGARWT